MHLQLNSGIKAFSQFKAFSGLKAFSRQRALSGQRAFSRITKATGLIVCASLLASCASGPIAPPADVEARDILEPAPFENAQPDEELDTVTLDPSLTQDGIAAEDLNVGRARYYQQQAQANSDQGTQVNAALSAAEYYIQGNDFNAAEQAVANLYPNELDPIQQDRLTIVQAYVANSRNEHAKALSMLRPLWQRPQFSIDPESGEQTDIPLSIQQVDALLLASFSYQSLGDFDSAIAALIQRERALYGAARAETTRYIWQVINSLGVERRQLILDSTNNSLVKNRIEQSLSSQIGQSQQAPQQFSQWREEQSPELLKQAIEQSWGTNAPADIAVLLPITSKFNKASLAVKDGINYQHEQNQAYNKPRIRFYDIGDNPYYASQFYASAVQSGADFIIGPLGKEFANQVSNFTGGRVPTLLLGGDNALNSSTSRLTMSPELDGKQVAERAWKDGHLSAALLVTESISHQRTVEAFKRTWLSLGGKITKTVTYSPAQYDHSVELKQLFDINQSSYRHSKLSRALGFKPKFSAYQRQDIDFVLMLANNQSGRLVRPQINFFSGSKVPVYSTSSVFNGLQNPIENMDLDDTIFPVMPWVLKSANVAPYAGQLNMLFAMGSDAYSVAGNYSELSQDPSIALNGNTGQLSIDRFGETIFQPVWAKFVKGEIVAQQSLGLDITPITTPNSQQLDNQNVKGNYNDSTWNSQKSSRKDPAENQR